MLFGASTLCRASTIAFDFSGGSANSGQSYTYGFQFTPLVDLQIDSLGFIDAGQDGLLAGHRVGIWNSGGTLLANTTVTTGNSTFAGAVVSGAQFRFTPITPLLVSAGVTYTIGAAVEMADDEWYAHGTNINNAPALLNISDGYYTSDLFAMPDRTIGNHYAIANFTATPASEPGSEVPEPSTCVLAGLGLSALALNRLRARRTN